MVSAERLAAALSIAAAAVHGVVAPGHFEQWWGYGLFFVVAGSAQLVFALLLITHGLEIKGKTWEDLRGAVYLLGIGGNLAIIVMWVVSRTYGVPFFGPEAGEVEDVGVLDVASKAFEVALVALLVVLWWKRPAPNP